MKKKLLIVFCLIALGTSFAMALNCEYYFDAADELFADGWTEAGYDVLGWAFSRGCSQ